MPATHRQLGGKALRLAGRTGRAPGL